MGTRVRLKAGVDISHFSPGNQVILRPLKTYGMLFADNGSNWFVSGALQIPAGTTATWPRCVTSLAATWRWWTLRRSWSTLTRAKAFMHPEGIACQFGQCEAGSSVFRQKWGDMLGRGWPGVCPDWPA
jgi:hypothetical protein